MRIKLLCVELARRRRPPGGARAPSSRTPVAVRPKSIPIQLYGESEGERWRQLAQTRVGHRQFGRRDQLVTRTARLRGGGRVTERTHWRRQLLPRP